MHKKDLYEIAEKLAIQDQGVKKLLDANKDIQAVIEKIREVMFSPVPDSEKITKVESIVDTFKKKVD